MKITGLDPKEIRRLQAFLAKVAVRMESGGDEDVEVSYGDGGSTEYCSMHPAEAFHPRYQYRLVRERWEEFVNIYRNGDRYPHPTRNKADEKAGTDRVRCMHLREVFREEE